MLAGNLRKKAIRLVSNISSYLTRSNLDEKFVDSGDEYQVNLDNIMYRAVPCRCFLFTVSKQSIVYEIAEMMR